MPYCIYPYMLTCRYQDTQERCFLSEGYATLGQALEAMRDYQQQRWDSVALTAVVESPPAGPRQLLAAGLTRRCI